MKSKIVSAILSISVLVTLCAYQCAADEKVTVELDGKEIAFDVNPQIIDGRTMVPLRKIFEEIGALVKWDGDTQTVSARKSSKTVTFSVGSSELTLDTGKTDGDGNPVTETVELDVPAQIVSDRTLVPVRAISESFGLTAEWDEDNQRVIITSDNDENDTWKENKGTVNLSDLTYTGGGIEIKDNRVFITDGGDFTLSGTLNGGGITVSSDEKVKLRLSGVSITSYEEPCIYIENADKAYITLTEGTDNMLTASKCEQGAVYAKDNLEIKGGGTLDIISDAGHGIKASDNLTVANGKIGIAAESDGIHVNDTFKMSGGSLSIISVGDGIDSESIVNISDGTINIVTNGIPITEPITDNTEKFGHAVAEEKNNVEFEKSSKGIKAEWMMVVSGGDITVNSASHAVHCADEIQIDGGEIRISSEYEKGISAHGNLTINGDDTKIDVKISTEGIESKNILTVNGGNIKVYSTDDAINATGGNSGNTGMPPGGGAGNGDMPQRREDSNFNGHGEDGMKPEDLPNDGEKNDMQRPQGGHRDNGGFAPPNGDGEFGEFDPFSGNGDMTPWDDAMPPMNESGRNMKDCLVINGGYLELYAEDDCLDSNGNLIINGGTIMAVNPTGTFSGPFAVIDPDGRTEISEDANLIFAAGSGEEKSLNLPQNTITVYCESTHNANDEIIVSDSDGNVIFEYTPLGKFGAVLIASKDIRLGNTYTVSIGDEKYETEISGQSTVVGTKKSYGGFGRNRT